MYEIYISDYGRVALRQNETDAWEMFRFYVEATKNPDSKHYGQVVSLVGPNGPMAVTNGETV